MKKILIIIAAFSLFCWALSSCKTTNDCPAYGSSITGDEVEQRA